MVFASFPSEYYGILLEVISGAMCGRFLNYEYTSPPIDVYIK
jgi:hypothetical protein